MGLKEIIANKKLQGKLTNLFCGISDSYMDITERVEKNKMVKSAAVEMLIVVNDSGKVDYKNLKTNNPQGERLFIESDKKFIPLFQTIEKTIEQYNADLTDTLNIVK